MENMTSVWSGLSQRLLEIENNVKVLLKWFSFSHAENGKHDCLRAAWCCALAGLNVRHKTTSCVLRRGAHWAAFRAKQAQPDPM